MAKPIQGTKQADPFAGTAGDDTIQGKDGNDSFVATAGNDSIDGGNGIDTITFGGNFSDYAFSIKGTGNNKVTVSNTNGTTDLKNVEILKFADEQVTMDDHG